jgi:hypothetical protein
MSNLNINGNWQRKKRNLQNVSSALCYEDLIYEEGKEGKLIKQIQMRLEISEEAVRELIRVS